MVTLLNNYAPRNSQFTPEKMVGSETRLLSICVKRFFSKADLLFFFLAHMLHVWNIYHKFTINLSQNVAKSTIRLMDPMA